MLNKSTRIQVFKREKKSVECKSAQLTYKIGLGMRSSPKLFLPISHFQLGKYVGNIEIKYFGPYGFLFCLSFTVLWPYVVWRKIDSSIKETHRHEATDRNKQINHIGFAKGTSRTIFIYKSYALICAWILCSNSSPAQSNAVFSLNNSDGFTFIIPHLTLDAFLPVASICN